MSVNTEIIYWLDDNEYYDLLGIAGEPRNEAIPAPVFCQILGLTDQNYLREIKEFLGSWFMITEKMRRDWQETEEE